MSKSALAISSALFCLVFTVNASALQLLDDVTMKKTGARGSVQIEIDNMRISAEVGTLKYTDNDGFNDGKGATVVVEHGSTVQQFNAITDGSNREGLLANAYGDISRFGDHAISSSIDSKNLTIGIVDELPILSSIATYSALSSGSSLPRTVSGIEVSLPTLEMRSSGGSHHMRFQQEGAINNDRDFCMHEISGERITAILGGKVEIAGR